STALALLADRPFDRLALARLCQRAEVEFVGMPSGIMDQYISIFGEAGAALCIDCRSLESRTVLLPRSTAIVAVNSMVKHELSQSAYRTRTEECARAVDRLRARFPAIRSLREVAPGQLPEAETLLPEPLRRRARHVISENSRVEKFVEAAGRSDLAAMGRLFVESHRSLQHDYEVSCLELDFLVDSALTIEGVQGARMTGGGFGGCTVNLVSPELQGRFQERIQQLYQRRFGITPLVYLCQPSAGAGESGT
ncbi:MAG: galactokinase, partial [Acidobacteria bacterium]|nr:galactokinase [Acidobacteriota bacterium]